MDRINLVNDLKKFEYKKKSIQEAKHSVTVGGQRLTIRIEKGSEDYRFEGSKQALLTYLALELQAVENEIQATVFKLYPPNAPEPCLDDEKDTELGIF